jgi:hypothetical protein
MEGSPTPFHWRWYYHLPTLPLWGLILVLLVVPKANRNRQAWLILIPLVLVLLVCRMPARLLSMPDEVTEVFGFIITSLAMAWSMVWLLGHRVAFGNRCATAVAILVVMAPVGPLSWYSQSDHSGTAIGVIIWYEVSVLIFVAGMIFAARRCRNRFSAGRFYAWSFVGHYGATIACLVAMGILVTNLGPNLWDWLEQIAMATVVIGTVVVLINLPFLILAIKSPFYRQRFEKMFGVAREQTPEPELVAAAVDAVIVEDHGEEKESDESAPDD